MTAAELREKIRMIIPTVVGNRKQADAAAVEYDELTKFPELKAVIVDLLTHEFDNFLASIDWVAPKPTTFRINLKNDQDFYLIYSRRSWIAQVEGKKYYLLNLPEEERATEAIARVLRYGAPGSGEAADTDSGGGEDVDVEVDDNVDIDV
jgi:hypothetical protein|tara:strand:- start:625 stop:1074 length:450 start_codon:yes stop_codon:yes gene_type:complete